MPINRPMTTLFMLMSVDGKISTGGVDERDMDKDLPNVAGVSEGLGQYYEIEQKTDLFSLNSGKVLAKIGANNVKEISKTTVSYIIIDNKPHLTVVGVDNFLKKSKKLYIVTNNKSHPAFLRVDADNLEIIYYENEIDFSDLFERFKKVYGIDAFTIQTGGTLNSLLLRQGLIDKLSLVVAPCLIGGKETSSLIDGESLMTNDDLLNIKPLKLTKCEALENSYIHLQYDVVNGQ